MNVTVSGTVLVPTADGRNLPADTSFLDLSGGTTYDFGDGYTSGSDGGGVLCAKSSKKRTTGRETYQLETHTYTKPGTYTFHYTVEYCGANGWFNTNKTTQLVIK
jgi:PKD repeat protein